LGADAEEVMPAELEHVEAVGADGVERLDLEGVVCAGASIGHV
jgi:hypothetical protein